MSEFDLAMLGWTPELADNLPPGLVPGRVIAAHRAAFDVQTADEIVRTRLPGRLVHESVEVQAGESDEGVVIITDAGEDTRFGLIVDELCGHQQVVIKSIEESYGSVPGIAGATILGNGRVAFILDVEKLSDLAANEMPSFGSPAAVSAGSAEIVAMN